MKMIYLKKWRRIEILLLVGDRLIGKVDLT